MVLEVAQMPKFRVLGPLEVEDDDGPLEVAGQRQRALLIALLLHANEVVPTDRLVDDVWGASAPKTVAAALHNTISQLRRRLGDALVTRSPGYTLRVDRSQVDAFRFEDLLRDARVAEPAERAALLREALALWRGDALLDVCYESFAAGEASRLDDLRLVAREELIEAELDLGVHDDLVPELQALVAAHPLRERLWGQLMLALYRAGRQGEASQTYQSARRTLLDELGIEPGPALKQLHGAIIRQEVDMPGARVRHGAVTPADLGDVTAAILAGRVVPVLGEDVDGLVARPAARRGRPRPPRARARRARRGSRP